MSDEDSTISIAEAKRRRGRGGAKWREDLTCSENGSPKGILLNAVRAFGGAPEWSGVLGF